MKNWRKAGILPVIIAAMMVLLTGCTDSFTAAEENSEQTGGEAMSGEENGMSVTDMTETEKKILIDVFGEEQRLEEGKLFSYEREALDQLRAGESYLQQRYPEYMFQTESFSPADRFRPWAELRFRDELSPTCLVKVFPSEDGTEFVCEDNFYGYLVQESYDSGIEEILEKAGCPARSYTVFLSTAGSNLPVDPSVEELLAYDPELGRQTALYVSASEPDDEIVDSMQKALLVHKMYGNYWVYFTGQDTTGDIKELEEEKSQWESRVFSCFEDD